MKAIVHPLRPVIVENTSSRTEGLANFAKEACTSGEVKLAFWRASMIAIRCTELKCLFAAVTIRNEKRPENVVPYQPLRIDDD